jgi:hypothetical protein
MKQLICIALLLGITVPLQAADWTSSLSGGRGDITVSRDNRATLRQGGIETACAGAGGVGRHAHRWHIAL